MPAILHKEGRDWNKKKFLSEFSDVEVEDTQLAVKAQVKIRHGILMNYHGIVLEVMGNKAKVQIESMGIQLSAIFEKKNLEPAW